MLFYTFKEMALFQETLMTECVAYNDRRPCRGVSRAKRTMLSAKLVISSSKDGHIAQRATHIYEESKTSLFVFVLYLPQLAVFIRTLMYRVTVTRKCHL